MGIDVASEIFINRSRRDVADYAANPDNAQRWYVNIKSVEWKTPKQLRVGSRIAFVAELMGKALEYTYEIVEFTPGERLVMRTAEGPFPMETIYTWESGHEGTWMTLRNRGKPSGLMRLFAPLISVAMRRANRKDLLLLKSQLENPEGSDTSPPTSEST